MLSFPFSHLQVLFPALASRSYLSSMQIAMDGVSGEGSMFWTCAAWVNAALCLGTWSDWLCLEEANQRLRLLSHHHIPFLERSFQTSCYLFTEMSHMANWGSAFSGQAGPVNLWRPRLAFTHCGHTHPFLGFRGSVVCVGGVQAWANILEPIPLLPASRCRCECSWDYTWHT